ncbi:MAG TPA: glycosyltransferase family 2 protein [Acidisarcina sp.]
MSQSEQHPELPPITVVVIGRNEGERLRRCLESVAKVNYPALLVDVIYIDSRSSDGSADLARSMGCETVVLDGPTTAARARNAGWTRAKADYVLFLDGDTILHPDFLLAALPPFEDTHLAGVGGNRRELDRKGSIYNAILDLDWDTPAGPKPNIGGDALVRVKALEAVGGFNADLIAGEEPEMSRRMRALGYTFLHIDAPMTLHDMDMHSFRQYWRRALRTGHAYAEISSIYARTPDPLWSRESQRNVIRGLFWTLIPVVCAALSLAFHSASFILGFLAIAALLIGRTVAKAMNKTPAWRERLAYAVHSHLQQVPILLGQLRFWLFGQGRRKTGLIEYKTS